MILDPKKATLISIIALMIISLISYITTQSLTALIPFLFSILIGICHIFYDKSTKVFAHIILVLLLVVLVALFMPLNKRIDANDFWGIFRIVAMQLVCLYTIACFVKSFIKARKVIND